jgi:hypothetical protein
MIDFQEVSIMEFIYNFIINYFSDNFNVICIFILIYLMLKELVMESSQKIMNVIESNESLHKVELKNIIELIKIQEEYHDILQTRLNNDLNRYSNILKMLKRQQYEDSLKIDYIKQNLKNEIVEDKLY